MRVNEVISRCRTDQSVIIHYDNRSIVGTVYEIYSINLVKAFNVDEDGDDSRSTAHLHIIAKEDY